MGKNPCNSSTWSNFLQSSKQCPDKQKSTKISMKHHSWCIPHGQSTGIIIRNSWPRVPRRRANVLRSHPGFGGTKSCITCRNYPEHFKYRIMSINITVRNNVQTCQHYPQHSLKWSLCIYWAYFSVEYCETIVIGAIKREPECQCT